MVHLLVAPVPVFLEVSDPHRHLVFVSRFELKLLDVAAWLIPFPPAYSLISTVLDLPPKANFLIPLHHDTFIVDHFVKLRMLDLYLYEPLRSTLIINLPLNKVSSVIVDSANPVL